MLVCEVALGNMQILTGGDFNDELQKDCDSKKALGRRGPSYDNMLLLPYGAKIPLGAMQHFNYDEEYQGKVFMNYNEYVVFSTDQIRVRYILRV